MEVIEYFMEVYVFASHHTITTELCQTLPEPKSTVDSSDLLTRLASQILDLVPEELAFIRAESGVDDHFSTRY